MSDDVLGDCDFARKVIMGDKLIGEKSSARTGGAHFML
jgi:hypothetical protein